MRLNKWEAVFWDAWQEHGMAGNDLRPRYELTVEIDGEGVVREFDFGSPKTRLLIEVDGLGGYDPKRKTNRCGGHQTPQGMANDSAKRNAAVLEGWRVLVFPSSRINSKPRLQRVVEEVNLALCSLSPMEGVEE